MARVVKQYLLAAVIALLAMQGVTASVRVVTPSASVCRAEVRQQKVRDPNPDVLVLQEQTEAPAYVSRAKSQPDSAALFQRPPPVTSLIS